MNGHYNQLNEKQAEYLTLDPSKPAPWMCGLCVNCLSLSALNRASKFMGASVQGQYGEEEVRGYAAVCAVYQRRCFLEQFSFTCTELLLRL